MNNIKISVIIPIYNAREELAECLSGVLAQSLREIEVICVDDGSSDGSADVVAAFAAKDARVRYIRQKNLGSGPARNAGIGAAQGEFVAFLDADDCFYSGGTLERLYTVAVRADALICGGSMAQESEGRAITDYHGDYAGYLFTREGWVDFKDYQFDYGFYRFLYKRAFLREKEIAFPSHRRYQDPPFMLRAFSAAEKFYAVPDVTYCYRTHAVGWNEENVLGLLCGIEENLRLSARQGLARLHALNYKRLNKDFCGAVVDTALLQPDKRKIVRKLVEVQRAVDCTLLRRAGVSADEGVFSAPLEELLAYLCRMDERVYAEGWFIRRKLFRLYTWPVRAAGRLARGLRPKKK